MGQIYSDYDLIWAIGFRSGSHRLLGARAAALGRRSYAPRRRSAGESELGATGLGLGRGLAEGGVRCVRNAPGVTAGLGEALLGLATTRGRSGVAGVPCAGN